MTLDELPSDVESEVVGLDPDGLAGWERRRLMEIGIVPGTRIRAVLGSPLGDPVAYHVRGALIALRRTQARWVHVQVVAQP